MLLSSLVTLRHPTTHVDAPEDIFDSSLGALFPDDTQNQHGTDPDTTIVYANACFGALEFRTAHVNGEDERRKFAHYLWNAGVLMGELVGGREGDRREGEENLGEGGWWVSEEEGIRWNVAGEKVLELGAGVGLGGIISVLAGAEEVAITDYPAPSILVAIRINVAKNVPESMRPRVAVQGHLWGSTETAFEKEHAQSYTRILAADCFWMSWEHENLAKSMLHFLSDSPNARILCIAGFHTGRAKLAPFFQEVAPQHGLFIEDIFEMKADGSRRAWAAERDGGLENIGERKKWLVVARLKRA
ncbi:hypothetical protein ACEQ8H_005229 [Pleosporales sp. CAS-2024a]